MTSIVYCQTCCLLANWLAVLFYLLLFIKLNICNIFRNTRIEAAHGMTISKAEKKVFKSLNQQCNS